MSARAITFDLFGTLVHLDESRLPRVCIDGVSLPSLLGATVATLRERVPSVDLSAVLVAYFEVAAELTDPASPDPDRELAPGEHFARCLERVGVRDAALVGALAQAQLDATFAAACLDDDVVRILGEVRDGGHKLGLISNVADADGGRALLSRLGLDRCFDVVVFSGDVGYRKPDRRVFETALASLQLAAQDVVHVGDELRADVWGAARCGFATVWLNATCAPFDGPHTPTLTIPTLGALLELTSARRPA
jgi:HAD superfamily hydrolase (TIGR01509 family)